MQSQCSLLDALACNVQSACVKQCNGIILQHMHANRAIYAAAAPRVVALQHASDRLLAGDLQVPARNTAVHPKPEAVRLAPHPSRRQLQGALTTRSVLFALAYTASCLPAQQGTCVLHVTDMQNDCTCWPLDLTGSRHLQVCGFSGTNDTRWLLPFSVETQAAEKAATGGTDGNNILTLLRPGKVTVFGLTAEHEDGAAPAIDASASEALLLRVLQLHVQALIDAGAYS